MEVHPLVIQEVLVALQLHPEVLEVQVVVAAAVEDQRLLGDSNLNPYSSPYREGSNGKNVTNHQSFLNS